MKKAIVALGSAAIALGMVLTTAIPALAQETLGSKTCSSTQQYGVTTELDYSTGTSGTMTKHTLGTTVGTYYGFGAYSTSRFGMSSGSYVVYTPYPATFQLIRGFCMPKGG